MNKIRTLLPKLPFLQRTAGRIPTCGIVFACLVVFGFAPAAQAQAPAITNQPGFTIVWDGNDGEFNTPAGTAVPTNIARATFGAQAFGSGQINTNDGAHDIDKVINGVYGNGQGWIGGSFEVPPGVAPGTFVGVRFSNTVAISSIAWGRQNNNTFSGDRWAGTYTLQVTTLANPDGTTTETGNAATGWSTVGTVTYAAQSATFRPWMRHRYGLAQGGNPISATGVRIVVAPGDISIDEIEINPPSFNGLVIEPDAGYSIVWDGNDGEFTGANAPTNVARSTFGSQAFGSGQLFADGGAHDIDNVINGTYGNASSWINGVEQVPPGVAPGVFIGVRFSNTVAISSIAWGRENNVPGGADRWAGNYTLQVTTVANPDGTTTETGDKTTGWANIGVVRYLGSSLNYRPWMRHRYDVAQGGNPIQATGVRIRVSGAGTCIDEIEVNPAAYTPLIIQPASGFTINWDGNDGQFYGDNAPTNAASAVNGGQSFGSGQLLVNGSIHDIDNVIDGLYGNGSSWIHGFEELPGNLDLTAGPFIGVRFTNMTAVSAIAWGRANDTQVESDRSLGTFTLQLTTLADPDAGTVETGDPATGWVTIGTIQYLGQGPGFRSWMRHRYDVKQGGNPIQATGLRMKVAPGTSCIDELEVNPLAPPALLSIITQTNNVVVSWTSVGTLQSADAIGGPWGNVNNATNPMVLPIAPGQKFFRVKQ